MEARFYDRIGSGYSATRRTEPRIAARIEAALGTAETVVTWAPARAATSRPDGG